MKENFYGQLNQTNAEDDVSRHVEEIAIRGFTVMPSIFSPTELITWRQKVDNLYARQEDEFGRDTLAAIYELDVCRAPILYDFKFVEMACHPRILAVVREFLGEWFILNVQNAIINRPDTAHHQSSWHRDLPYQNYVISKPLAITALFTIDEFSEETGGTHVLPFTHKREVLPSNAYIDNNRVVASASAGSAIIFDSMLFHRAGANRSRIIRRAVNHVYTTPIIKQNYDFPRALGRQEDLDPLTARLLGYTSQVPLDDKVWRKNRTAKLNRNQ